MLTVNRFVFMTGSLQRLIMTVSLQKGDVCLFSQKNVTISSSQYEGFEINQLYNDNKFKMLYLF